MGCMVAIGYDEDEKPAFETALASLQRVSPMAVAVPVDLTELRGAGLYQRPTEVRNGQKWDVISGAPMSTSFAISRFFVPYVTKADWALFVDSDVVFCRSVEELLAEADSSKALQCVHHEGLGSAGVKKVNKTQTVYGRKNWSSVMLWNLRHPAHERLTLEVLNGVPGRDLHQFCWLVDDELGALSPKWNWLVNVQAKPDDVGIAHFTLGGPWLPGWKNQPYDDIWLDACS